MSVCTACAVCLSIRGASRQVCPAGSSEPVKARERVWVCCFAALHLLLPRMVHPSAQTPNPQHRNVTELKYILDKRWSKGGAYLSNVATTQVHLRDDMLDIR